MNFIVCQRSEIPSNIWDRFCLASGGNLNHLAHFLDYYALSYNFKDLSFGVFFEGELLAVVPIFLYSGAKARDLNYKIPDSSVRNPCPLIMIGRAQIELVDFLSKEMSARISTGVVYEFNQWNPSYSNYNHMEHLFRKVGSTKNLLVDLSGGEDQLFKGFSKGHQRTISKSTRDGQFTTILDCNSSTIDVENGFWLYKRAHEFAAGRITRPNESFQLMLDYILSGVSVLFIAKKGTRNLSFLYCDFIGEYSRQWSKANSRDLLRGEFPSHQLEFEAMKYFSKVGVKYYHFSVIDSNSIGTSDKLDSINMYKLRFHPLLIEGSIKSLRSNETLD